MYCINRGQSREEGPPKKVAFFASSCLSFRDGGRIGLRRESPRSWRLLRRHFGVVVLLVVLLMVLLMMLMQLESARRSWATQAQTQSGAQRGWDHKHLRLRRRQRAQIQLKVRRF